MSDVFDTLFYTVENLTYDVDRLIEVDREYFLERREELIELLEQLKERIEDE